MLENAFVTGFRWFLGTATFAVCWLVFIMLGGLIARLLGGAEEGEDDDE